MSRDVDGYSGPGSYYLPQTDDSDDDVKQNTKAEEPPTIISCIRALFSQTTECNNFDYLNQARVPTSNIPSRLSDQAFLDNYCNQAEYPHPNFPDTTYGAGAIAPAPKFSDVKRIITDFAVPAARQLPASCTTSRSHSRIDSDSSSVNGSYSGQSDISQLHSASSALTNANTPPLTPDSFNGLVHSPSFSSSEISEQDHYADFPQLQYQNLLQPGIHIYEEDRSQYIRRLSHSQEIKEGKKPQRPICYDTLIADITDEPPPLQQEALCDNTPDEWYGMEYTLELSRRDRRGSNDYGQTSVGEHSKSRESWAVIHQGTVHPFQEDEEYYHWKRWHRYLDRQDEKRKMKKALAFMTLSEDLAYCYAEEIRTWDWIRWQQEQLGGMQNVSYAKEHLYILAEHRPDPYYPPTKHGLGWHLKRSRSVSCLRELYPVPVLLDDLLQPHKRNLINETQEELDLDYIGLCKSAMLR